ncbi:hypothetical protein HK405_007481, partial [Cladochytrium tenue]
MAPPLPAPTSSPLLAPPALVPSTTSGNSSAQSVTATAAGSSPSLLAPPSATGTPSSRALTPVTAAVAARGLRDASEGHAASVRLRVACADLPTRPGGAGPDYAAPDPQAFIYFQRLGHRPRVASPLALGYQALATAAVAHEEVLRLVPAHDNKVVEVAGGWERHAASK